MATKADNQTHENRPLIVLTGATGYVGGRLLKVLEERGHRLRCLVRRAEFIRDRAAPETEVVQGDVLEEDTLPDALRGADVAYYLVHSMGSAKGFEEEDRRAACNFAKAAKEAGVRRIIYLGGLGESGDALSPHLRSRHEVGEILRESGVQVIEFRSSIVIGSGSLSFEMVRALVERLPVMITPRWVFVSAQPIGIGDLLDYLVAALSLQLDGNRVFEIGGADVVSYGDVMREYARQRGLRRFMIPVPVLTPRLSSLWLGLVTPLYARIGRKLIDSIRHPTVIRDESAKEAFDVRPKGLREEIANAIRNEDRECAETRWSDALSSAGASRQWGGVRFGNRIVDTYTSEVNAPPEAAFKPIERIGGRTGWYFADWLWRFRGFLDLLAGGVGIRRGRRNPVSLKLGDVVDCWRVEAIERPSLLRLAVEMKVPGRTWLEFEIKGDAPHSTIRQTIVFDPIGLFGLVYWYFLYPLHRLVFAGMLRGIVRACKADEQSRS